MELDYVFWCLVLPGGAVLSHRYFGGVHHPRQSQTRRSDGLAPVDLSGANPGSDPVFSARQPEAFAVAPGPAAGHEREDQGLCRGCRAITRVAVGRRPTAAGPL